MKQLIISIIALGIILTSVVFFNAYSQNQLGSISKSCDKEIVSLINDQSWADALDTINHQYDEWSEYKKFAAFFNDANEVNNIEEDFLKTIMYIKAKDDSNSNGELASLSSKINYLKQKENVSFQNIL